MDLADSGKCEVVVKSPSKPSYGDACVFDHKTIPLDESSIATPGGYVFETTFNPTRSVRTGCRAKRTAIVSDAEITQWLVRKLSEGGAIPDVDSFVISNKRWVEGWKRKAGTVNHVKFFVVTVRGCLTVANQHEFLPLLRFGMGKEKRYGCGLLKVRKQTRAV